LQPGVRAIVHASITVPTSAPISTSWTFLIVAHAAGDLPIQLTVNLTVA
jgi:hypothetical protein